tara:strand:+ start:295 stop:552 length:258 start_codon:yes stop_codon:yes gene_type:complete
MLKNIIKVGVLIGGIIYLTSPNINYKKSNEEKWQEFLNEQERKEIEFLSSREDFWENLNGDDIDSLLKVLDFRNSVKQKLNIKDD